jgi:hypothetical protein
MLVFLVKSKTHPAKDAIIHTNISHQYIKTTFVHIFYYDF